MSGRPLRPSVGHPGPAPVIAVVALAVMLVTVAGACGGSSPKAVPVTTVTTSTVPPAYPPTLVYGWVSTTLDNGISLVDSVPAGASDAELLPAAEQLGTACAVSAHELTQTEWSGVSMSAERSLDATLARVQTLVSGHPAGFGTQLRADSQTIVTQLRALRTDLPA